MISYIESFFTDPVHTLIFFLLAFPGRILALSVHEFAHAWVANRCGDPTAKMLGRMTINPLKHLDPLGTILMLVVGYGWAKPVPVNPRNYRNYRQDDLKVSLAGVTMNLILFILSMVALAIVAGMAIARESHDVLLRDGIHAYEAVKAKLLTPAVENVIEANILLSGLGFLNAGCACAHGVHNGISALENGEEFLHGEKVAFGLVCQLVLENAPREELNAVLAYLDALDLPVTLGQLHIEPSDRNLDIIVDYMMNNSLLIHREPIPVTADMVRTVILAADTFGRQYLERTR